MKSILLIKKVLGLVELAYASFSLPKWQAVKMTFFAPWTRHRMGHSLTLNYMDKVSQLFWPTKGEGRGVKVRLACRCPCLSQLCQGLHQGGCQLCFREKVLQLNSRRWGWSSLWAEVSFWHVFWNLQSHAHGLSFGLFRKHTNYMTHKTHERLYQC